MKEEEKKTIKQGFLIIMIIWGFVLASLIIYLAISFLINDILQIHFDENAPITMLKNAFYVASIIIVFSIKFIRNELMPEKGNKSENRVNYYMGKYTVAIIVSSALSECIGIFGLVFFFLSKSFNDLYIFLAISAAALIFYRPKKSELIELMS